MDIAILKVFGAVAGIGGLALGVFLILFREVIRKALFPVLGQKNAYRLLRLFLVLVWSIAIAGMAAWVWIETRPRVAEIPSDCNPKVSQTGTLLFVTLTWECQQKGVDKQALIKANFEALSAATERLILAGSLNFIPAGETYVNEPTDANWATLRDQIELIRITLKDVSEALFRKETGLSPASMGAIAERLRFRSKLLHSLPPEKMTPDHTKYWLWEYKNNLEGLRRALELAKEELATT